MKADSPVSNKKPYCMPTLTKYGSLTQMTSAASKKAPNMDGATNSTKSF
jgi:hypothetical protein